MSPVEVEPRFHAGQEATHRAAVDGWLAQVDAGSSAELVAVFHAALETLWNRALTTLGSVTLTAIVDRVLINATQRHGFLAAIDPRAKAATPWKDQLHDRLSSVPRSELIEGVRFALIEMLTVIGSLTAEILSRDLHAALLQVTPIAPSTIPGDKVLP